MAREKPWAPGKLRVSSDAFDGGHQREQEQQERQRRELFNSLAHLWRNLIEAKAKATNDLVLLETCLPPKGPDASDASHDEDIKRTFNSIDLGYNLSQSQNIVRDIFGIFGYAVNDVNNTGSYLSITNKTDDLAPLLRFFDIKNVPEGQRAALAEKINKEIARLTRPKWRGRLLRGGELATLSAPSFLRRVHAEDIAPDGSVRTEIIRAIDPELMQAVEMYISKRKLRKQDRGDAEGLKFVLKRPRAAPVKKRIKGPQL